MPESKTSAAEKQAPKPTSDTDKPAPPATSADPRESATTAELAGPEPGVYEYTHGVDCVYPHVPLTARAARPERAADPDDDTDQGEPAVAATVFDWPDGPPGDGRWTKTRKKPNQAADNEPALSEE